MVVVADAFAAWALQPARPVHARVMSRARNKKARLGAGCLRCGRRWSWMGGRMASLKRISAMFGIGSECGAHSFGWLRGREECADERLEAVHLGLKLQHLEFGAGWVRGDCGDRIAASRYDRRDRRWWRN